MDFGKVDWLILIPSIIIIGGIFYFGLQLFASFYDISGSTSGDLQINQENIDQLSVDAEDASTAIFQDFNFDNLTNAITPYIIVIIAVAALALIITKLT